MKIFTFDTTLRDGTQGESVSFSVDDKLLIAQKLDELGIDYIEGGWPGSNPKDKEFFARAARAEPAARQADRLRLHALRQEPRGRGPQRAARWSSRTRRWSRSSARAGICTSSARSASPKKRTSTLISETVQYLKEHGREVVYDAEHFFDGYIANPRLRPADARSRARQPAPTCSACATPTAAPSPAAWSRSSRKCASASTACIGIHTHNDSDVAVANTLAAVEAGATHVQGCMNGYGERCGNANLASVIANLELKLGHTTIGPEKLASLSSASAASSPNWPTCRCATISPSSAKRLRPQGRRARQRGAEGFRHLRAHHARSWSAIASACW